MYPFGLATAYPRNRWYIAALSAEITQTPFERMLLDVPVALYRTEDGRPVAMYGRCPHRFYPLALGRVEGDGLVCGYHGFKFAASGKCVRIPAQNSGANFEQPTYPLEERGTYTWIWMGDPKLADPSSIPPYEDFGLDQPGWAVSGGYRLEINGRSQLLIDNLMDLTHLPHVHHHVPGGDAYLQSRHTLSERPRSLRLTQEMPGTWSPFFEFLWGADQRFDGEVMLHQVTDFYGPEFVKTSGPLIDFAQDGEGHLSTSHGIVYFLHGVTPAMAHSTHFFCAQTRNFRIDDDAFGQALHELDEVIRMQDVVAINHVEPDVERSSQVQRELLARSDRAAAAVRERIKEMILAEQPSQASEPAPARDLAG
ncbi:Rieske (2Fe-2S) domain protein [Rhizorhabdus wittichii RW1]|uniref:Rieske (2Fe-2S) domain protein n=1 Tax=Rhizorhabdus wittichii (strain DSM 6014 / CCUG 31198 / JCM 15750 / NBRC 105917 / EY 4224 / RW1) TaxID=392499 RepID=A0A9J9HA84_RHIWR|nr:Rieske (2Fe-2S) domain protein [Rhizorhabdus wittichii RW1]